jgi:hypothetical protein
VKLSDIEPGTSKLAYITDALREKKQKALLAEMTPHQRETSLDLVNTLNRNVTAQEVFDEMGRQQGSQCGPEFSWHYVTEEFKAKFLAAYAKKPSRKSAEDFAREFVDKWPSGAGAMHMPPDWLGLAQPPYTKDGLWPSDFKAPPGSWRNAKP